MSLQKSKRKRDLATDAISNSESDSHTTRTSSAAEGSGSGIRNSARYVRKIKYIETETRESGRYRWEMLMKKGRRMTNQEQCNNESSRKASVSARSFIEGGGACYGRGFSLSGTAANLSDVSGRRRCVEVTSIHINTARLRCA